MTLEIGARLELGGGSGGKSAFSFLDLLNGATPLSPQNLGWSGDSGESAQENFSFLLLPPSMETSPGSNSGESNNGSVETGRDGSRRSSHSHCCSDTMSSSSASTNSLEMPDLQVWGIGDGNDKE